MRSHPSARPKIQGVPCKFSGVTVRCSRALAHVAVVERRPAVTVRRVVVVMLALRMASRHVMASRSSRILPRHALARLCSAADEYGGFSACTPRLTKIVATIGPASEEAEPLAACVASGMNIMRVNFSHATVEEFYLRRKNLHAAPCGQNVAVSPAWSVPPFD